MTSTGSASATPTAPAELGPMPAPPSSCSVPLVQQECSQGHCVGLTALGEVWGWAIAPNGNRFGQLGRGFADTTPQPQPDVPTSAGNVTPSPSRGSIFEAEKIVLPSGVAAKHVSAGGRKDSGHTSIVDVDGGLWTVGCDRWTQLGQPGWEGGRPYIATPVPVAMPGGAPVAMVSNGADHTAVSLQRGGVVAFGRGHKGQLTGGLRGPGTAKPFFSWALSKGNPVAVKAEGDCTCVIYRSTHSADLLESSKDGRAMLGGNVRGRQFGNPAFRCHGDCGELLQKLQAAMERVPTAT